jgi:hypothetical protein
VIPRGADPGERRTHWFGEFDRISTARRELEARWTCWGPNGAGWARPCERPGDECPEHAEHRRLVTAWEHAREAARADDVSVLSWLRSRAAVRQGESA